MLSSSTGLLPTLDQVDRDHVGPSDNVRCGVSVFMYLAVIWSFISHTDSPQTSVELLSSVSLHTVSSLSIPLTYIVALLVFDWVLSSGSEFNLIWMKPQTSASVLYAFSRYCILLEWCLGIITISPVSDLVRALSHCAQIEYSRGMLEVNSEVGV